MPLTNIMFQHDFGDDTFDDVTLDTIAFSSRIGSVTHIYPSNNHL